MTQLQKNEQTTKRNNKNNIQKRCYKIAKKRKRKYFAFWVITFEPNKMQTRSAPQMTFVKDIYVVGEKMTRNGGKMANTKLCVI